MASATEGLNFSFYLLLINLNLSSPAWLEVNHFGQCSFRDSVISSEANDFPDPLGDGQALVLQ